MFSLRGWAANKLQPLLRQQRQTRLFVNKNTQKSAVCAVTPNATVAYRPPQTCAIPPRTFPDTKPCFDLNSVLLEQAGACHEKIIRSFLYTNYWPREPSTVSMYLSLCSPYLAALTEKYATSGDRLLAFERLARTKERRPVGVLVANKTFRWEADEYEEWGNANCHLKPERANMYFRAYCIREANVFDRYHVDYAYEIQVLATAADVTGQGVALLLLRAAILQAMDQRHPLVTLLSKSAYTHKVCERAGMKKAWDMQYADFVDQWGNRLFFPRYPHETVVLYVKQFDPHFDPVPERWKNPELFEVYKKVCLDKKTIAYHKDSCEKEFPLFPKCQT